MRKITDPQSGQAQLLTAAMMGGILMTGVLYSLDRVQSTGGMTIKNIKKSQMRNALDQAVQHASYLYRAESACDPVLLNRKLARMATDGTLQGNPDILPAPPAPTTQRLLNVEMEGTVFPVSFGSAHSITWDGSADTSVADDTPGVSQDAALPVWTSVGNQKMFQFAVLINDCTTPCSAAADHYSCGVAGDRAVAYHSITDPANYPTGGITKSCYAGARYLGDLDTEDTSCTALTDASLRDRIDLKDYIILRNYLRSGDLAGSCSTVMVGATPCADFNSDTKVNESDLNILGKNLRGYLNYLKVR
ncbi:MAG: hypothetical protein AAB425_05445 [Bdellovibrionota bacterium]